MLPITYVPSPLFATYVIYYLHYVAYPSIVIYWVRLGGSFGLLFLKLAKVEDTRQGDEISKKEDINGRGV